MESKLFVATKAFINWEGKILVIRESSKYGDGTKIGEYDVIGGRIEPAEALVPSVIREVKEETGLDVTVEDVFFANESFTEVRGEHWHIVRVFYACTPEHHDVVLSADHDSYLWIDPKEYKDHGVIENLFPAFEKYNSNIK